MIFVFGSFVARPDRLDEAVSLSRQHCGRSRAEPGCLSHDMYHDVDDALRLRFVERWADRAALAAHFAVPATREFVRAVAAVASHSDGIEIFEANALTRRDITG